MFTYLSPSKGMSDRSFWWSRAALWPRTCVRKRRKRAVCGIRLAAKRSGTARMKGGRSVSGALDLSPILKTHLRPLRIQRDSNKCLFGRDPNVINANLGHYPRFCFIAILSRISYTSWYRGERSAHSRCFICWAEFDFKPVDSCQSGKAAPMERGAASSSASRKIRGRRNIKFTPFAES